ncbi:Saccharopine dehydrogenase [Oopsacas minuta]|uniref:Saccharopine dehydrogenase n=1 Tax=Oopsacas minuta TaxID=111878 RepID=A0AAV7K910_9METZ|nr:Saccharopine dehydrogenase [Oopsacas minuta]
MSKIAVFGCGLVTPPFIRYFNRLGVQQIIATRTPSRIQQVVKLLKHPELIEVVACDVNTDNNLVRSIVAKCDAVASMLPASSHFLVLQHCVAQGVSAVTPSVASDAVRTLDQPAKKAGVLLLNECGQSPGLDHVDTIRLANMIHTTGGKIRGYTSLSGSLATVEGLDNPLEAKLTWSPHDWLMHSWNPACYLRKGLIVDVPWNELYIPRNLGTDTYPSLGNVVWFYNRDATMYTKLYGLNDVMQAERGVHDYPKAMRFIRALQQLGLTSVKHMPRLGGISFLQFLKQVNECVVVKPTTIVSDNLTEQIKNDVRIALERCDDVNAEEILDMMDFIGLFSNVLKIPEGPKCALEVIAHALQKITIRAGEPDSAVNRQIMQIERKDGSWEEWRSTLEIHGQFLGKEDDSAAAKLTGLPVAVAVKLLLEKKLPRDIVGVNRPIIPDLYNPILDGLEELGVQFRIAKRLMNPILN